MVSRKEGYCSQGYRCCCATKTPHGKWPVSKITHTYSGEDEHVHTVKVLMKGKEYQQPITRICPLQIIKSDNQENGP